MEMPGGGCFNIGLDTRCERPESSGSGISGVPFIGPQKLLIRFF